MKRWHYRRSLASRVALLTTLSVGIAVAFMAAGAFFTMRMQLYSTLDESLLDRATKAARYSTLASATAQQAPPWMLGAADVQVGFVNLQGDVLTADGLAVPPGKAELAVARGHRARSIRTLVSAEQERYRVATVPAGPGLALVLQQPLANTDQTLRRLRWVMLSFGGGGVLAATFAGWGVARNGLRPVRRLTHRVEGIARTQELRPLPVEGDDEIARLGSAFNQMLVALSASRDRERRLVADAGHELRTPLTSLRTNLDLLSQAGDGLPAEAREELLDDVRAQVEELSTLVGDLMELARDEPLSPMVSDVELGALVERAVGRVRRRAPAGVRFDVELEPWTVQGESAALERAVTNLLDNAVKWSPDTGVITVRLADGVLTIDDQGPGIDAEDLPHVFERFYRSDDSRTMPGSGLGLAIVRQAVERHSGAVRADHAPGGGARLVMWLPGGDPHPAAGRHHP